MSLSCCVESVCPLFSLSYPSLSTRGLSAYAKAGLPLTSRFLGSRPRWSCPVSTHPRGIPRQREIMISINVCPWYVYVTTLCYDYLSNLIQFLCQIIIQWLIITIRCHPPKRKAFKEILSGESQLSRIFYKYKFSLILPWTRFPLRKSHSALESLVYKMILIDPMSVKLNHHLS